jgi:hypothetical protein
MGKQEWTLNGGEWLKSKSELEVAVGSLLKSLNLDLWDTQNTETLFMKVMQESYLHGARDGMEFVNRQYRGEV